MTFLIHHPKKGFWQATCGWFPNPANGTKYTSQQEAETVMLFNPPRFCDAEAVPYNKEYQPCPR